jgi:hypothetical protein
MLVVCEGKTEATLIEKLRGAWRIPSVDVRVCGQIGVPKTVVEYAKRVRGEIFGSRRARASAHEVWVVFDRDEHDSWLEAIRRARALGFHLATSNPCVELWALLLHGDQRAHIERRAAQRKLSQVHANYDHARSPYFDRAKVEECYEDANRRARLLLEEAKRHADEDRNPTTRFGELVAALAKLKR